MSHRIALACLVTLGFVILAIPVARVAAANVSVAAVNYQFSPASRTVHVGDTVVWTMSGDGHTVTSGTLDSTNIGHPSGGPLKSGFKGPGASYSFTFTSVGTYPYFCEIHADSGMKGTITVVATAASPSPRPTAAPTPRPTPRPTSIPAPRPTPRPTLSPTPASTPTPDSSAGLVTVPTPSSAPSPTATLSPATTASPSARPVVSSSPVGNGETPTSDTTALVAVVILVAVGVLGLVALRARKRH